MKITIKKTLEVTAALEIYIEEKLMPLSKFIAPYEKNGAIDLWLEVSRTTAHHRKGEEIFMAVGAIDLPGKVLRAEASAEDIRTAIDEVRDILHREIEKYKTQHAPSTETEREK